MNKKILIVDDDLAILDAISLILIESNYDVRTESSGNQVVEKVITYEPQLILIDVLISGQDGRTICKILKNNDQTKNIPIVMISAHPSAKESSSKFGADDFLSKPFELDDLLSIIEKHIH